MLRPRYQYPTRWYPSREKGSGNGCLSGEENTDLEQEVSGTLSKGDHSHPGEQDFCVPAITIQGGPAMSVFVVGLNGCRLMPTSERKAFITETWESFCLSEGPIYHKTEL